MSKISQKAREIDYISKAIEDHDVIVGIAQDRHDVWLDDMQKQRLELEREKQVKITALGRVLVNETNPQLIPPKPDNLVKASKS